MNFFLFLFSSGQDSLFFLFIKLIYGVNLKFFFLSLNHQMQVNGIQFTLQNSRISIVFQKSQVISILDLDKPVTAVSTEETLRFMRYNIQNQVAQFYKIQHLGTGHTNADFYETFLFDLFFKSVLFSKTLNPFKNKILISKQYSQKSHSSKSLAIDGTNNYTKKQKKRLLFFPSFKQKKVSLLTRPIKKFNRTTIKSITHSVSLPIFIDSTNFTILLTRNQIRRYFLIYVQKLTNEI